MADGWRMRGADTRTGSGTRRLKRVCGCAAWVARVRGLRLARGLCEIRVGRVEACGFVGMAAVVGRGWQRRGKGGSAAAWAERCGWIGCGSGWGLCGWLVVGCVCWRRDGALVGDLACDAGAPAVRRPLDRGLCCVQRVRAPLRRPVLLGDAGCWREGVGGCGHPDF